MNFINDDFMLHSDTAKELYHKFAEQLPIIDYHCHLDPKMVADDHRFTDAYELFLGGDHYKWRQMRSNGVEEEYITGSADGREKFRKFAETMPYLIGNPLYHWTHLELARYFDIFEPLCADNADRIFDEVTQKLAQPDFSAKSLITKSRVETICTTDDPADDLASHKKIAADGFGAKVLPTFRPDKAVEIGKDTFIPYMNANGIDSFDGLLAWLTSRIEYFASVGCRLSDHSLEVVPFAAGDASAVFDARMQGKTVTKEQENIFRTAVLKHLAAEYAKRGWTMQLHIGALRNNNTKMFEKLGPDAGFDSINDLCIAENLSKFLNACEYENALPKTILYTLNPKDNYVLGAMLGNFQKAPTPARIQFGSGWWFNDQRDGMEAQMQTFANLGILGRFVGMLTDSRSFVSYPRHEYFRRIMCNLIGGWVEKGEYPKDMKALERIVSGISYYNAKEYFGF